MTDIYHLPKSDHPSWHRKRRSNDPQVDDEVSFQSPCNDMAISFPGSNSTARPRAWQRSNCPPPPGKASIVKCPAQGPKKSCQMPDLCPHTPPPPPGLYIDTCIKLAKETVHKHLKNWRFRSILKLPETIA